MPSTLVVGAYFVILFQPMGSTPPYEANQIMISRLACVALVALIGSASRNMSSATSATTSLFARSDVEGLAAAEAAGASVHEADRLNLPMFHNCIGRMGELRFTLGKE